MAISLDGEFIPTFENDYYLGCEFLFFLLFYHKFIIEHNSPEKIQFCHSRDLCSIFNFQS